MKKYSALIFLLISLASWANKRDPFLVTVQVKNQSVRELFTQIESQLNRKFSYNTALVNADSTLTYSANKPLAKVINDVFKKRLKSKVVGNYIVLVKRKAVKTQPITISGYVYNSQTKSPLPYSSIYEVSTKKSSLTDANGKFELVFEQGDKFDLSIAKKNYADTLISMSKTGKAVKIYLSPTDAPLQLTSNPTSSATLRDSNQLVDKLVGIEDRTNAENLQFIHERSTFQVSLVPTLSTNFKSAGVIENQFSLNVLGGYNGGVDGVEVGGLFNILTKNMKGVQIAGLTNQVEGTVYGFQVGGIHNRVVGNVTGMQVAGINNFLHDSILGMQVSGISNIVNGTFEGFQIAGIQNHVTRNFKGFQLGGIINWAEDSLIGLQVSAIGNILRGSLTGLQLSGIHNLTVRNVNGVQLSAIHNQTFGTVKGVQLAVTNYAKTNNGLQLGLINVADSANGIAIGLFNYVRNGYHPIEIFTNEVLYANIAYKSGVDDFYSTWTVGMRPSDPKVFGIGFGVGTHINIWKWFSVSADITSTFINEDELDSDYKYEHNLLNRVDISLDFNLGKFTITTGPGLNIHSSQMGFASEGIFTTNLAVDPFYTEAFDNTQVQMWWGAKAGLRYNF